MSTSVTCRATAAGARCLRTEGDTFTLDGRPHRIISGSISYFRMLPQQWQDRLEKLIALGCNAVEVYVPWNLHEPKPGVFCFDGRKDLPCFLDLCQDLGVDVLLRPGPYICAEWDFGGLPWWLLCQADPVALRSSDEAFLKHVRRWWLKELLPRVRRHLAGNGGPILAVQIENEFGYWGCDPAYLEALRDMLYEGLGVTAIENTAPLLFTSDGTFWPDLQRNGGVKGALRTANFGSDARQRFAELRKALPSGPLVNMEFWVGWFDAWGSITGKSYRAPEDVAQTLQETLEAGASVNFFVFHGGTSFGFCGPGANISETGQYEPQVTSYDYGGLLDEAGEVTEKYLRCREVLADFLDKPELLQKQFPQSPRLNAPPQCLELEACLPFSGEVLMALGGTSKEAASPLSAEQLGCGYGYVLYGTDLPPNTSFPLQLGQAAVRDFASVMVDGQVLGTVWRNDTAPWSRQFNLPVQGKRLEILVEIMGRANFGPYIREERKGLVGSNSVLLGSPVTGPRRALSAWQCTPLPMTESDLEQLPWSSGTALGKRSGNWPRGPRFFRYALHVRQPADGFLALDGFTKGFVCINGFNIGRYWEVGPQRSLYLPGPLLKQGRNEIIIFDVDHPGGQLPTLQVVPDAIWTSRVRAVQKAATSTVSGIASALNQLSEGIRNADT